MLRASCNRARWGFQGTYIHLIVGYRSRTTHVEAQETLHQMITTAEFSEINVYVDTMVSRSYSSAVAQLLQIPGISGQENNLILFECPRQNLDDPRQLLTHYPMAVAAGFDIAILTSSPRRFGYPRQLHVWLTPDDFANTNPMILLSYIISGHPSWARGEIKIFAISKPEDAVESRRDAINRNSTRADLTILGLRPGRATPRLRRRTFRMVGKKTESGACRIRNGSTHRSIADERALRPFDPLWTRSISTWNGPIREGPFGAVALWLARSISSMGE